MDFEVALINFMDERSILFAELLCARAFHFFSDAMFEINTGISFLSSSKLETQMRSIEFLSLKVQDAINKLKFLKHAYESVHAGYETDSEHADFLIKNFLHGTDITFNIKFSERSLNLKLAKLVYNLVIIMSEFILYSGGIKVDVGKQIVITGMFTECKKDIDLNILTGLNGPEEINANNIQCVYTKAIAHSLNYYATLHRMHNQISIALTHVET